MMVGAHYDQANLVRLEESAPLDGKASTPQR